MIVMPKVSVIIPAYNAESYIGEALGSIMNQTWSDFECILINDCSTDQTAKVIRSWHDNRIILLHNEVNMGIAATYNKGLDYATGTYVARMDADDISLPERLRKQVEFLDANPDIGAVGSAIARFCESSDLGVISLPICPKQVKVNMLSNQSIANPSSMFRTSILNNNNLRCREEYDIAEDYDFWSRFNHYAEISNLPDVLLRYRVHAKQATQAQRSRQELAASRVRRYMLNELVPDVPELLFWLYNQAMMGDKIDNPTAHHSIFMLFRKMIQQNLIKKRYDHKTLKQKLALIHFHLSQDGNQSLYHPIAGVERLWFVKRMMRTWLNKR